jgi:hypothetical protein
MNIILQFSKKNRFILFRLLVLSQLYICQISGQIAPQVSLPINVFDNTGGSKTLNFGIDETATESIDVHLGESDLPPYPPSGAFDARFLLPENNFIGTLSSYNDFRFASGYPFSDTIEYRLRYQGTEGATAMFVGWSLPPEVTGLLQDLVGGVLVNVAISGTGVYEITNFTVINQLKIFVYYNNILTSMEDDEINSESYSLSQNYPNPFNGNTLIKFSLVEDASQVKLTVYNSLGKKQTELVNRSLASGSYEFNWNAENASSGIYFYELRTENFLEIRKMCLLK